MSFYSKDAIDMMMGEVLEAVKLTNNKGMVVFRFQGGGEQAFSVEGDCCSESWIEQLEAPSDVKGATLVGHVESGGTDETENDKMNPKDDREWCGREHESLKVYHDKFTTDRGDIILEYRNSSNGYYGGYLVSVDKIE